METCQSKGRLEKEIEAVVIRMFPGVIQLKTHVRHWPDRIFFLPGGRVVLLEFKKPGGRLSPGQKAVLKKFRELGFGAHWVDSVSDATKILERYL